MFRVAVCICTCDRATLLARVLAAVEHIELRDLRAGERPADRGRQSRRWARRGPCATAHAARLPIALRFVEEPTPGISFARNRATSEALRLGCRLRGVPGRRRRAAPGLALAARCAGRRRPGPIWSSASGACRRTCGCPHWLRNTRYFRPPEPDDRNRFGLPGWAGTYNVLMARRVLDAPGATATARSAPSSPIAAARTATCSSAPRRPGSAMPAPTSRSSCAPGSRTG